MCAKYLVPIAAGVLAATGGAVAKCAVDADNRGCLDKFGVGLDECPAFVDSIGVECDTVRFISDTVALELKDRRCVFAN